MTVDGTHMLGCNDVHRFPDRGRDVAELLTGIGEATRATHRQVDGRVRGKPDMPPDPVGLQVWAMVSGLNPNNGGMHTRSRCRSAAAAKPSQWRRFQDYEMDLIGWFADLYCMNLDSLDGYVVSGSTEGNIMGLWVARNWCRAIEGRQVPIAVLAARSAHYSIPKAADLLGFEAADRCSDGVNGRCLRFLDLDEGYRLSLESLSRTLSEVEAAGIRHVILCLTMGTTVCGAVDPLAEVCAIVRALHAQRRMKIYIHMDAAFGGMVVPFAADPGLRKLSDWSAYPELCSMTVDLHKMGGLPYGCGIFLCQKERTEHIERRTGYTAAGIDATLLGSRSGAMVTAAWAVIGSTGRSGFVRRVAEVLSQTDDIRRRLSSVGPVALVPPSGLNVIALELDEGASPTQTAVFEARGISAVKTRRTSEGEAKDIVPIYVMPGTAAADIDTFVSDLQAAA